MDTALPTDAVALPRLEARFQQLLEQYRAPLARLVAAYEREPAERQDLLQDIWLALWKALPTFRGDCSERTFVYRVAHNRAITHASRRRLPAAPLEDALDIPQPGADVEQHVDANRRRALLLAAIRDLPLIQREVVTLSLESLSGREIAEILGITENNVAVRLSRARAALSTVIKPEVRR